MLRGVGFFIALFGVAALIGAGPVPAVAQTAGPAAWQNDLTPITAKDWNYDLAAHLLERAGFGGTPEEIQALAKMTPAQAIAGQRERRSAGHQSETQRQQASAADRG